MFKKKYQKPKITEKKVKMSFFLSNVAFLDTSRIIATAFAGSGSCSTSSGPAPGGSLTCCSTESGSCSTSGCQNSYTSGGGGCGCGSLGDPGGGGCEFCQT